MIVSKYISIIIRKKKLPIHVQIIINQTEESVNKNKRTAS